MADSKTVIDLSLLSQRDLYDLQNEMIKNIGLRADQIILDQSEGYTITGIQTPLGSIVTVDPADPTLMHIEINSELRFPLTIASQQVFIGPDIEKTEQENILVDLGM